MVGGECLDVRGEVLLGGGEHRLVRDDVGLSCTDVEGADGGPRLPELAAVAHAAQLDDDAGGDQAGVATAGDRGGAGVGGLPVQSESLPGYGLDALDDADGDFGFGEDRALLDMALDEGVRDGAAFGRGAVEADALELVLDGLAVGVGELVGVVERYAAGGDRRAEHVGAEPDALLLREEADLDVAQRLDAGVVEGAHHLDAAEHAEGAVEGSVGGVCEGPRRSAKAGGRSVRRIPLVQ